ncbi:MAG: hypothetical protein ACP5M7_09850 [Thermoproteota archaeon]
MNFVHQVEATERASSNEETKIKRILKDVERALNMKVGDAKLHNYYPDFDVCKVVENYYESEVVEVDEHRLAQNLKVSVKKAKDMLDELLEWGAGVGAEYGNMCLLYSNTSKKYYTVEGTVEYNTNYLSLDLKPIQF